MLRELVRKLWIRESRFLYRGRAHHRIEHVFRGRMPITRAPGPREPTENVRAGLVEWRWRHAADLRRCQDNLLPGNLPELLEDLLGDRLSDKPLMLVVGYSGTRAAQVGVRRGSAGSAQVVRTEQF